MLDQLLAQVGAPTATATARTTPTPMPAPTPIPGPIGIIDTHTHLQGPGGATVSGLQQAALAALDFMKQSGIQKTLMMNPPSHRESKGFDADQEFFNIVQQYPDSFAFLGGGPTLSPLIIQSAQEGQVTADVRRSFEDRAEAIVQMGAAGFGETAALHISFVEGLPFIEIPADTTLFLLLADIAARNDMPIDLHMEAVAEDMALPDGISLLSNPSTLRENISGLERLLAHNRDARIVWSHAGWDNTGHRTVALMRRLLETHTNLYMNIKLPIGGGRDDLTPAENQPVDDNGRIRPQWLDLLQAFPDRFVLGSEAFYDIQAMARGASRAQSPFIDQLPPDLARKVGYENAARIYRLTAAPTATPTPSPTPTPTPIATPRPPAAPVVSSLEAGDIAVTLFEPDLVYPGTTVFMDYRDSSRPRLVEVDIEGQVVWEYLIPEEYRHPRSSAGPDVKWLPNGDILFVMPYKGVYQVNRNKEIVWSYETNQVSHDADRLPNGNTLMVWGWDERSDAQVKEVNEVGEVVWSWYASDHLNDADIRRTDQGYTHTNSVIRLANGNTFISLRNFNMLVEVDPTGEIVWSLQDAFINPHDPEILPNGNILVADQGEPQRTMEITREGDVVWTWLSRGVMRIRNNHMLPNGNILIVERISIIEITPNGKIVWRLELRDVQPEQTVYKAVRISR